jgi:hypothetical protein
MTKKEKVLKAYEEYLKARGEFVKENGWHFESSQTILSEAKDAAARDLFVKELNLIEEKYNTK